MAGFVTNVAGNLLIARKSQSGWWVRIVSNLLWTIYAGTSASFSLNVNHAVFFVINVYGWWRWREDRLQASGFRPKSREEKRS